MDLLNRNGPDCMINKFAVNFKIMQSGSSELVLNPDVDMSTEYSKKIGRYDGDQNLVVINAFCIIFEIIVNFFNNYIGSFVEVSYS